MSDDQALLDLLLIHGFWSSTTTWDPLAALVERDNDLDCVHADRFGYESPKIRWPLSPTRIPDYDDIAHSLRQHFALRPAGRPAVVVTHSQGGLILQRAAAWLINEGRARELASIHAIVLLACPNEGSEYLGTIRRALGFGRHPQAGQLATLASDAAEARRTFLRGVVSAREITDRTCPIPVHAYAGRTDNIVTRASAQSVFGNVGSLPGSHATILDPAYPGSMTFAVIKAHILEALTGNAVRVPEEVRADDTSPECETPPKARPKYHVTVNRAENVQIGDHNRQINHLGRRAGG